MPLSQRTLEEMAAGAKAVATSAGFDGDDKDYFEAMVRTQQRANYLLSLERERRIKIERHLRPHTNDPVRHDQWNNGVRTTVWVGEHAFEDPNGEMVGAWPSEVLVANVMLALAAGEAETEDGTRDKV